jgi:hypothetical protein
MAYKSISLKLVCLTVSTLIGLAGCIKASTDSDKDIYEALFKYLSQSISEKPVIVISDKAVNIDEVITPISAETRKELESKLDYKVTSATQLKNMLPATSLNLQTRFIEKLKTGGNLNKVDLPVSTKLKLIFVKNSELDAIFDTNLKNGWKVLPTKYSGAKSLVSLSLPAIDTETDTALVYAGVRCGWLCGQGYIFLLAKLKGKWTVMHMHNVWIS